jgi:phosphoribosylaminoimidazolecarboxamide formyltransferase/IMP cyclohydrolase
MAARRALISVSDKTGVVDFARRLVEEGYEVVSSGGTATEIAGAGVPVAPVSKVTGAPEILGGRVKTLHPDIHGGILADRSKPEHMAELEQREITPIDIVVCNLYPFERTIVGPDVTEDEAIEQIDIGGPAMVRAAAKNFHAVTVVVDPADYDAVCAEIAAEDGVSESLRRHLALKAFSHTARYDATISRYLGREEEAWPPHLTVSADKVLDLRYGENPHQSAAFYRSSGERTGLAAARQLHGKELSYNNLLDADAAWRLALELDAPAAVIVKHSNPCGVAYAPTIETAYERALECDRTSAFGGIVALNAACTTGTARRITEIFTEVVLAPDFESEALAVLAEKANLRVLRVSTQARPESQLRTVAGGLLVQSPDLADRAEDAKVVTRVQPTEEQWSDLRLAWVVAKHVKSNAIVLVNGGAAIGVGAGQMSRVESTQLAAKRAGRRAEGSVCASDAFFPFRDGVDAAAEAGAVAVIQPGGSVRDNEVIEAADECGMAMVFTGRRHFRH